VALAPAVVLPDFVELALVREPVDEILVLLPVEPGEDVRV
jgi:hypothetical protein